MGKEKPKFQRYIDEQDMEELAQDPDIARVLKETDNEDIEDDVEESDVFSVPKPEEGEEDIAVNPDFTDFFEAKPKRRKRRKSITEKEIEKKLFEEEDDGLEDEDNDMVDDQTQNNKKTSSGNTGTIPEVQEFIQKVPELNKKIIQNEEESEEEYFEEDEDDLEIDEDEDFKEDEDDDEESDFEDDEDEDDDPGFEFSSNLEETLFAPPKVKPTKNVQRGINTANQETIQNEHMEAFTSGLKSKRKNFWDDLKNKSESDDGIIDAEPKESKLQSQSEFRKNINTQVNQDRPEFLSFKKTKTNKVSDGNIHYTLSILFDKLNILGFRKDEAANLIQSLDADTINKFTSVFSTIELTPFHFLIMKEMRENIENLQTGGGAVNPVLAEFMKTSKVMLHNVQFISPDAKIKITQTNYGLLPSRFIQKIIVNSLDQHLKKTRRQYLFSGVLRTGAKIDGLIIPLDKVPKSSSNMVNLFARFGYTVHKPKDGVNELVYMFLGKDQLGNKSIYLIK